MTSLQTFQQFTANWPSTVGKYFAVCCLILALTTSTRSAEVQTTTAETGSGAKGSGIKEVAEQDFKPLLGSNVKQLWRGYAKEGWPAGWSLEGGVLARVAGGGDIMTVEEFADFDLRLEFKVSPAGNSGIQYRVSTGDEAPYYTGMEFQVLDDSEHRDGKNLLTSTGSLYALYARSERATLPVGEWNKARIIVQGNHVEHWLNGKKMVECEIGSDDWNERLAKSKFAEWPRFAKNRQGHIALQDHNDPVWYRNIRIQRLDEKK